MLQALFPSACNFLYIDETPLVTCSCIKKNHVCQIMHEVKEEYGDIFVWESDDNEKAMQRQMKTIQLLGKLVHGPLILDVLCQYLL